MIAWWEALTALERGLALCAIPATVILLLQTILLLFGIGGDGGDADFDPDTGGLDASGLDADGTGVELDGADNADLDMDSQDAAGHADAGLRIFTVRGFVAFFAVFGWCGIVLIKSAMPVGASLTIAFVAGVLAMVAIAMIFKGMIKLQAAGNVNYENAVGKVGTVYITIPKLRRGRGKVTLVVQERLSEVDAVTDSKTDIAAGAEVTVVAVNSRNELVVRPRG